VHPSLSGAQKVPYLTRRTEQAAAGTMNLLSVMWMISVALSAESVEYMIDQKAGISVSANCNGQVLQLHENICNS